MLAAAARSSSAAAAAAAPAPVPAPALQAAPRVCSARSSRKRAYTHGLSASRRCFACLAKQSALAKSSSAGVRDAVTVADDDDDDDDDEHEYACITGTACGAMCRSGAHGALAEVRAVHGVLRELVEDMGTWWARQL